MPASLRKVTGSVSLTKDDQPVMIERTPLITASVSWKSGTDYDVYALVLTANDGQVDVAMFGADGVPARREYAGVRHCGDVGRGGGQVKTETIEIRLTPEVLAVVPVAYSAQSNGTGSFRRYKVSLSIDNGQGTTVTIDASHASADDKIYSCVPGMIRQSPAGVIIDPLELYSKRKSEQRPALRVRPEGTVEVVMHAGPKNDYK